MRILYYDCFSGISGDMNLGAMIDIGIDQNYLTGELKKLNLEGWELEVKKEERHGIYGTMVSVIQTREEHHHRHLSDVSKIIMSSGLSVEVKELALRIFMRIAEAEAKVHNCAVEKVHFHEVGAVDSIIDIVGAAICYNKLDVEGVFFSPVELGGGTVKCAHGVMPVPAPATAEIIKNMPVVRGGVNFEATTPTGAAIIAELASDYNANPGFSIESTGYGIGHKKSPDRPNILRVFTGTLTEENIDSASRMIEANIDDMSPELWENVMLKIFEEGADDVFLTNIIMKKSRPAIKLSVLTKESRAEKIKEVIFRETTTIGLREYPVTKTALKRSFEKVPTKYGEITIKTSYNNGILVSMKPELDDCVRASTDCGVPLKNILSELGFVHGKPTTNNE